MNNLLFFVFSLLSIAVLSQENCSCSTELDFVIDYYERNLPGFKDNVTDDNIQAYTTFKEKLFNQSKNYCNDEDVCFKTLLVYVEFFKDNHSSIYTNKSIRVDENNEEDVQKFLQSDLFTNRETINNINPNTINPIQDLENQYQMNDLNVLREPPMSTLEVHSRTLSPATSLDPSPVEVRIPEPAIPSFEVAFPPAFVVAFEGM